jgi:hypothetical protein
LACLALLARPVEAEKKYTYAPNPHKDTYFGHISFVEISGDSYDPLVYRRSGAAPERAVLNFPLGPGDTVMTSALRRCEIQFDTGTLMRLDIDTKIKIETILAPSVSTRKKISIVNLEQGRIYVMYKRYNRPEIFQLITSNAAFKLDHNSVCSIASGADRPSDVWVDQGKVRILYGPDPDKIETHKLKKSQQMRVTRSHALDPLEEARDPDFQAWNLDLNENFLALHEGLSKLPKPIKRYPDAVIYFAQRYAHVYGEWMWHDLYGLVWKPYMGYHYPYSPWRPYTYGQWTEMNGQMFWVPQEPWGWVPYHLGIWTWDKKKGWLWLPGNAFAPAWVEWNFLFGGSLFCWNPIYPWSWLSENLWAIGYDYTPRFLLDNYFPSDPEGEESGRKRRRDSRLSVDPKLDPVLDRPGKLKDPVKRVKKALQQQDPALLESLRSLPQSFSVVHRADLAAPRINEKLIEPDRISSLWLEGITIFRKGSDPAKAAAWSHRVIRMSDLMGQRPEYLRPSADSRKRYVNRVPARLESYEFRSGRGVGDQETGSHRGAAAPAKQVQPVSPSPGRPDIRFRDWNPDVRIATRLGLTLRYDSGRNLVHAPALAVRVLNDRRAAARSLFSGRGSSGSGSYSGDSSSGSSSSSSSTASSRVSSSGTGSGRRGSGKRK